VIVGVLGAGQLGRMLALAGYPLGLRFRFLDPASGAPAGKVAEQIVAAYDDLAALERFAQGLSLVTYEFENVPVATAEFLMQHLPVFPPPMALEVAQDRLAEKRFFRDLEIPTADFAPVDSRAGLDQAIQAVGLPALLKTRRFGYDGKGQWLLQRPDDADAAWAALGRSALILEPFLRFDRELSILAVRGRGGATAVYPLVENEHRQGILRLSRAPAHGLTPQLQSQAEDYALRVLEALDYTGVLAIELFQCGERLIANEMAPRVHNSGHWTIEGAATSQFENHLRAVIGWPLGSPAALGHTAMVNLIGGVPETTRILHLPSAHLHLYGKTPRPGRKLGHVTLRAADAQSIAEPLAQLLDLIE
jgi:5-(carboxyamino)imidazole ribonucleotide synthase